MYNSTRIFVDSQFLLDVYVPHTLPHFVLSLSDLRNRMPIIEERHACRFALFLANAYAELGLVKPTDDKITGSRHRKGLRVITRHPAEIRGLCCNYCGLIVADFYWDKLSPIIY